MANRFFFVVLLMLVLATGHCIRMEPPEGWPILQFGEDPEENRFTRRGSLERWEITLPQQ